jgi:HNH endonuclease
MWNTRYAGAAAGQKRADDYVMVRVIIGGVRHDILKHRLIWALTFGRWPETGLDHIDGDGGNNRIDNLRPATQRQNMQNIAIRSPKQGTAFDRRSGRWQALLGVDGKKVHPGMFPTLEAAHAAYLKAKSEFHQFQPVPRG